MESIDILKSCQDLETRLSDRGFITPSVQLFFNWGGADFNIKIEFRNLKDGDRIHEFLPGDETDIAKVFEDSRTFIENLESPDTARKSEFLNKLGQLIDTGNDIGINVEFMNPLTEAMGRLSSNILENSHG